MMHLHSTNTSPKIKPQSCCWHSPGQLWHLTANPICPQLFSMAHNSSTVITNIIHLKQNTHDRCTKCQTKNGKTFKHTLWWCQRSKCTGCDADKWHTDIQPHKMQWNIVMPQTACKGFHQQLHCTAFVQRTVWKESWVQVGRWQLQSAPYYFN